jgi:hypothetical protein
MKNIKLNLVSRNNVKLLNEAPNYIMVTEYNFNLIYMPFSSGIFLFYLLV